jgi:hypothetical protein
MRGDGGALCSPCAHGCQPRWHLREAGLRLERAVGRILTLALGTASVVGRHRPGSRRAWLDSTDDSHAGCPRWHQDASSLRGQTMSVVGEGQSVQFRPVAVMEVDRLTQTASPGMPPHFVPTALAGVSAWVGVLSVSGTVLRTWTSKGDPPGARWNPSNSVPVPAGSGAMRLSLSSHGSPLRVVRIVVTSSSTTA